MRKPTFAGQPFFVLLLLVLLSHAALAQERLLHVPPDSVQAGSNVELTAGLVPGNERVRLARIYFKSPQEREFEFVSMEPSGKIWRGTIPASRIDGQRLEYFLQFTLQNNQTLTFPESNARENPEELYIRSAPATAQTLTPSQAPILLLAPDPQQIFTTDEVLLVFAFDDQVDPQSLIILLDQQQVTENAIYSDYVVTLEAKDLQSGSHQFRVLGKTRTGEVINTSVPFFVKTQPAPEQPRAHFTGHAFTEGRYENVYTENESFAMAGGDFSGQYGALHVQGRAFLTSLHDNNSQPLNRFYLSGGTEAVQAAVGDIYPRYNDLIMWGKRVRGVSGSARYAGVKLEAIFGETQKAIAGRGSSSSGTLEIAQPGTFRQTLIGVRPSVIIRNRFEVGLSVVKIKDDINSVQFASRPRDNVVVGPDMLLTFDNGRTELQAQLALSALTYDASLESFDKQDLDDIFPGITVPINPAEYRNLLVINDTTVPLDPRNLSSFAYDVSLKLHYFRNRLRLGYKQVGSDYFSLANTWLRNDIRGFYLNDRVRLWQNKVYFTLNVERFTDNFSKEGIKPPTDLNSTQFSLSYYPGIRFPYLNLSFRDYHRDNGITDIRMDSLLVIGLRDTLDTRENSRQQDITVQVGYQFNLMNIAQFVNVSYIAAIKRDKYDGSRLSTFFPQEFSSNILMFSWTSTFGFPLKTTLNVSTNDNTFAGGRSSFQYNAVDLFGEYELFRDRLAAFAELRLTSSQGDQYNTAPFDVNRQHLRFGGYFYWTARHTLSLDIHLVKIASESNYANVTSDYTDQLVRLRYEYTF